MTSTNQKLKKDVTESAKEIRAILKAQWPEVRFSVRSARYAGGSSVDVTWTDGPTQTQVDQMTAHCKGYANGYYCDYIITSRRESREVMELAAEVVAAKYGVEVPEIVGTDAGPYCDSYMEAGGEPIRDLIHRLAFSTDLYNRDIRAAFEEVYPAPTATQEPSGLAPEQDAYITAKVTYDHALQAKAADLPRLPEDPTDADFEYHVGLEVAAAIRYRVNQKHEALLEAEAAMIEWARAIIAGQMAGHPELEDALGVLDVYRRFPSIRDKVIAAALELKP